MDRSYCTPGRVCLCQAFLVDMLEDEDYLNDRRKLLRQRAGLSAKDTKVAFASEGSTDSSIVHSWIRRIP